MGTTAIGPVVDVTPFGAKGDAKTNPNGQISAGSLGTLTLTNVADTAFSPGDIGKAISVNGAGLAAPTLATITTTPAINGGLVCGSTVTVYYQVTFIKENGSRVVSESVPTTEASVAPFNPTGCNGMNGMLTINAPTGTFPTGATAWLPYVSYTTNGELLQAITGSGASCTLSAGGKGCSLTSSWTSGGTGVNLTFDTARPPSNSVLLTTISGFSSSGSTSAVTLTDSASAAVSGAQVAWGTDNSAALANAIAACLQATKLTVSNPGCTVFLPGPTATTTGKYFVASSVLVNTVTIGGTSVGMQNLSIVGGGSFGSGDVAAYNSTGPSASLVPGTSAEIVGSGRFPLMKFGAFGASNVVGLNIINLGFRDVAGNAPGVSTASTLGNTFGAVQLINVIHPYIERLNAANFGLGYGIEMEGDPASGGGETQIGQIVNSNCSLCRIGLWGPQAVSDIQVQGGTYSGSGGTTTICYGADFESITNGSNSGSIRITGTAFRNHTTAAVRFFDCQGCQVIGIKGEQVMTGVPTPVGTAISIDGTSSLPSKCAQDTVIGGGFANYASPTISIGANCTQPLVVTGPGPTVTDSPSGAVELSINGVRPGQTAIPSAEGTLSYDTGNHVPVWGLGTLGVGRVATFSNGLSVTPGDCVQWANSTQIGDFSKPCTPNNAVLFFACSGVVVNSSTIILFPGSGTGATCSSTTIPAEMPLPFAGTLKNLYVVVGTAGKAGDTVTVWKNNSSTMLSCPNGTSTSCNDTSDTVSISAGDTISVRATTQASDSLRDIRAALQLQ